MWYRLRNLLDDPGNDDRAYVYRVEQFERPIKPYLVKYWLPGTDLGASVEFLLRSLSRPDSVGFNPNHYGVGVKIYSTQSHIPTISKPSPTFRAIIKIPSSRILTEIA